MKQYICDFCGDIKEYIEIKLLMTAEPGLEHICRSCKVLLKNYIDRGDFKNSIYRADYGVVEKEESFKEYTTR